MKQLLTILILISFSSNINAETCYEQKRSEVFSLFEKAFKKHNVSVKNLYWISKQTKSQDGAYSNIMTFDGKSKRGLIFYDKHCSPKMIKISSGYGKVTMYFYEVKSSNLKLKKTRKNTYRK